MAAANWLAIARPSPVPPVARAFQPAEPLQHRLQLVRRNARTAVQDKDGHAPPLDLRPDVDLRLSREFQRAVNNVARDAAQRVRP